jgi:hypothetical protein
MLLLPDGHYLNLPVIDHTQEIVGMVDVLKLTYATLEQINTMSNTDSEGPAWNKFWLSLDHETESMVSGDGSHAHSHHPTNLGSRMMSPDHSRDRIADSVAPGDSASHVGVESPTSMHAPELPEPSPADVPFTFKFKAPSGRVHRLQVTASDGIALFVSNVAAKLGAEADGMGGIPDVDDGAVGPDGFALGYLDDEGDTVAITTDNDLVEAIVLARQGGRDKVDLFVHHPDKPPVVVAPPPPPTIETAVPTPASTAVGSVSTTMTATTRKRRSTRLSRRSTEDFADHDDDYERDEDDDDDGHESDTTMRRGRRVRSRQGSLMQQEQVIAGVPNELLLPGAIGFLAVVILGVFTISRLTSR